MDYSDHCGMMPKSKATKIIITMAYFDPYTWGNIKSWKKNPLIFLFSEILLLFNFLKSPPFCVPENS